jgi:hypothetical protein
VYVTEKIGGKGLQLLCGFHQPAQHRVRIDRKDPGRGTNAQAFGQARQDADEQRYSALLPMQERAMMLGKVALARGAVELSPGTATGMAVGTKVAQPAPAAIAIARMGTEVLGGLDRAGASVRWWHRVGSYGRGRLGRRDVLRTQGTVWFLGQAGKRFGGVGALAAWRDGYSWMRVSGVLARPGLKQQAEQPHACDQCELVEKQVRHHGNAPSHRCEIGALYLAFEARQLSATLGYATNLRRRNGRGPERLSAAPGYTTENVDVIKQSCRCNQVATHTESGGLGGLHRSFSSACYRRSKEKYALRSGVESTLSQGVRRFDLRQSRYPGLARTHLQQLLTATAMNVVQVLA